MADKTVAIGKYKPNGVWEADVWNSGADTVVDPDGNPIGSPGTGEFSGGLEFTVGSYDAGDTLDDCDFLHRNGVYDGIIAAMQAIYDFGYPNKYGTIYIRRGHYISQTRYYLSSTNASIQGAGRDYTKIEHKNTIYQSQFQIHNTSIHFKDLTFICQNRYPAYNFMYIGPACRNIIIERCRFEGKSDALCMLITGSSYDKKIIIKDTIFDCHDTFCNIMRAGGTNTKIYMSRCRVYFPRTTQLVITDGGAFTLIDLKEIVFENCVLDQAVNSTGHMMYHENVENLTIKDSYLHCYESGVEYAIYITIEPGYHSRILIEDCEFDTYTKSIYFNVFEEDAYSAVITGCIWKIPNPSIIYWKDRLTIYIWARSDVMLSNNIFYTESLGNVDPIFTAVKCGQHCSFEDNIIVGEGDGVNLFDRWTGVEMSIHSNASGNSIKLTGSGIKRAYGISGQSPNIINDNIVKIEADTEYDAYLAVWTNYGVHSGSVLYTPEYSGAVFSGNILMVTNTGGTVVDRAIGILPRSYKETVNGNVIDTQRFSDTGIYCITSLMAGTVIGNSITSGGVTIKNTSPLLLEADNDEI